MGNHGSRRDGRQARNNSSRSSSSSSNNNSNTAYGGQAVHALKRVEELRGPPVDSYDKLIAWLSEMAESDNVHLDTSVFVKQLTTVCRNENSTSNGLSNLAAGGSDRGSSSSTGLTAGARRSATLRQNSASCESRASSSDTHHFSTGRSTYSRSFDDALDPRLTWRQHAFSSRQATCSDELEEDPDVRNASMESLYSGSDRDSEVEAMASTYCSEPTASRRARFSQQRDQRESRRPLLRQALLGSSTCSSVGDVESRRGTAGGVSEEAQGGGSVSGRYSGYGSCSNRSSMVTISSTVLPANLMPFSASMGDLDKINTTLEEPAGEQVPVTVLARRRSISLLNLTPPGRAAYYVPDAPPPDTPPGRIPPTEMFLDDTLLDGNLADILFSVEALWPKK